MKDEAEAPAAKTAEDDTYAVLNQQNLVAGIPQRFMVLPIGVGVMFLMVAGMVVAVCMGGLTLMALHTLHKDNPHALASLIARVTGPKEFRAGTYSKKRQLLMLRDNDRSK